MEALRATLKPIFADGKSPFAAFGSHIGQFTIRRKQPLTIQTFFAAPDRSAGIPCSHVNSPG